MKKIAYIMCDLTYPNGMGRVLTQKVNYLAEHTDYEVYAIMTENAGAPFYYPLSEKVRKINFDLNFEVLNTLPLYRKVLPFLRKQHLYRKLLTNYLMQLKPDITISILRREINFITDIPDGSKKIGEIHFTKSNYRQFRKSYLPNFINAFVTRLWHGQMERKVRQLDKCVILTREDKEYWVGFDNIVVIPNAISTFPAKYSDLKSKRVVAVGRYSPEKGYDRLIKSWRKVHERHPEWVLDIYGYGDNSSYVNMAKEMGISSSVHCNGPVEDIYSKYVESSIFAITSYHEGFGLVIAEAMAAGVPPVAFTFHCGPRDIISDGKDGILVADGDLDGFADALCSLMDDEGKRRALGENAIESARRYSEENIMKQWLSLFNETMKQS